MNIILVRHGKAEELSYEPDDTKRELTKKGKKEITASMPRLKNHLNDGENILIWTSPAVRAQQTAQIISDELEAENISSFDFIYTGDYASFRNQLENVDDGTTLIVVGHEPHLSSWSKLIYDVKIPFKKGSMAGFRLISRNPLKADLQWLVHSRLPENENPLSAGSKNFTKKDFKQTVINMIDYISDMQNQFLRYPDDTESVHQLRVEIRQLRSLLSFIKPILNAGKYKNNQALLKTIADNFAYMREIDVLSGQWQLFLEKNKDFSDCAALIEVLKDEREKEKGRLCEYASNGAMSGDLNNLSSWVESWDEDYENNARFEQFALKRFEKWNNDAVKAVKNLDFNNLKEIHGARIKFKKVRYVQSNIEIFYNNKFINLSELKSMQDILGNICDTYVNISALQKLSSAYNSKDLQHETGIFIGYLINYREDLKDKIKNCLED